MIKDSASLRFQFDNMIIQACDCDEDDNVQNADIIIDGKIAYCFNTQVAEQCKDVMEVILKHLWQVKEN